MAILKHAMLFAMKLMILQEISAKKMETELELDRTAGVLEVNFPALFSVPFQGG